MKHIKKAWAVIGHLVLAAAFAYGISYATPAHGRGAPLSLARLAVTLFGKQDYWHLFQMSLVVWGIILPFVWFSSKDKAHGLELFGAGVFLGLLVPGFMFQRLDDVQRLMVSGLFLLPWPLIMFFGSGTSGNGESWVRGTKLVADGKAAKHFAKFLSQEIKNGGQAGIAFWGGSHLPFSKENQHILLAGSPGSGKTQIMFPLVRQVLARGDKAIIWDVKGTYTQALLNQPGVELLAPWDKRSVAWRPGADIIRPLDCQQAASILIPENPRDPQPHFANAARQVLEAVLIHLDALGNAWGWADVWEMLAQGKESLRKSLQRSIDGQAAAALISGDTKGSQDVYATLMASTQPIKWLAKAWPREGISLRQWLKDRSRPVLILGGTPEREKLAGAVANLAIQMMVSELLSMPDDRNRRVWFFLDELASLGKLDAIARLSTMGRSKGGCVVAGIQDIGQIEHLYGRELTKSLANTFGSTIILRCSDPATAEWAADVIGKHEVIETRQSWTEGSHSGNSGEHSSRGASRSSSSQEGPREKYAFMPSQIANFQDMDGLFRLAGWPVAYLTWPVTTIPQQAALVEEAAWVSQKAELDVLPNLARKDGDAESPALEPRKAPKWRV